MKIIVEKNGIKKPLNPIGCKRFATFVDTPLRIVISDTPEMGSHINIHALQDKERVMMHSIQGTTIKVGVVSGRIIEVSSGSTEQMKSALNSEDFKTYINQSMRENIRGQINADASIGVINKVLK